MLHPKSHVKIVPECTNKCTDKFAAKCTNDSIIRCNTWKNCQERKSAPKSASSGKPQQFIRYYIVATRTLDEMCWPICLFLCLIEQGMSFQNVRSFKYSASVLWNRTNVPPCFASGYVTTKGAASATPPVYGTKHSELLTFFQHLRQTDQYLPSSRFS